MNPTTTRPLGPHLFMSFLKTWLTASCFGTLLGITAVFSVAWLWNLLFSIRTESMAQQLGFGLLFLFVFGATFGVSQWRMALQDTPISRSWITASGMGTALGGFVNAFIQTEGLIALSPGFTSSLLAVLTVLLSLGVLQVLSGWPHTRSATMVTLIAIGLVPLLIFGLIVTKEVGHWGL